MSGSAGPVLIGGEHRSGTTLLSVVLDSHPQLDIGPELDFFEPVNLGTFVLDACRLLEAGDPRVLGEGTATKDPNYYDVAHFVKQCERYGVSPPQLRELVEAEIADNGRDVIALDDRCRMLERIGRFKLARTGKQMWGIKLQRKIQDIDLYARLFDRARFVHIIRDGRDVAASHLKTVPDWGYQSVEDTAYNWANLLAATRLRAPTDRYLEVSYELLVSDPRPTCRRMCDFLGVAYSDLMLQHHMTGHTLHTRPWGHPSAEATRQALSDAAVGRFRTDLQADQIDSFENVAAATLKNFGYL